VACRVCHKSTSAPAMFSCRERYKQCDLWDCSPRDKPGLLHLHCPMSVFLALCVWGNCHELGCILPWCPPGSMWSAY
jgi:hypothetical protein